MDKRVMYTRIKALYPFLDTLSLNQERSVMDSLIQRRFKRGHTLAEEGVSCSSIFFIMEGSVRVFKVSEDGRELTLYRIKGGDLCLITASCILTTSLFPAIARVEADTEVAALPAEIFMDLVEKIPQLQSFLFTSSLNRLKDVADVVEDVTFSDMKQRLAKFLVTQAKLKSTRTLRITHEEMASEIGTAREVISRTLKELKNMRIVHPSRGQVHILSMNSLEELCYCD